MRFAKVTFPEEQMIGVALGLPERERARLREDELVGLVVMLLLGPIPILPRGEESGPGRVHTGP
jgi:hypothetical protein